MPHVLIIDDLAICRDPIELALKVHGFQTSTAASGREAFFAMDQARPDVVLLDVTMPEMDGLSVLRAIRRNPQFADLPVVLLTDRADSGTVLEAARHRISGYILKSSFTVAALMDTLTRCVSPRPATPSAPVPAASGAAPTKGPPAGRPEASASPRPTPRPPPPKSRGSASRGRDCLDDLRPIIARQELRDVVSHGLELRPLSATVHQVMALTTNANCSVDDVSHAVAQDQALSVRLLKTANSTAFTRGKPVDTVKVAVQRLGIQEVRHLVTTLAVLDEFTGSISEQLDARLFWEHSVSCGVIARDLAERAAFPRADDCFLWGVLHDVGRLILIDHAPELYNRVWEVAHERSIPLVSVERHMLTLDHGDILARALEHWRFPNDFITPVVNHHRTVPQLRRLGADHMRGAAIVAAANRIAHALLLGDSGDRMVYPADDLVEVAGLKDLNIDQIRKSVDDQLKDLKVALLARGESTPWPDSVGQLRDSIGASVRPFFVGSDSPADTVRAFFHRLAELDPEEPPNVAVIPCGRNLPFDAGMRRLATLEEETCTPLPILIIALDRTAETATPPGRATAVCRAPLNVGLCVQALNELLCPEHAAAAVG